MHPTKISRFFLVAALAVSVAIFPAAGRAEAETVEHLSTTNDQQQVFLTIYNNDLALVRDRRQVELRRGENLLAWSEVSARIRPETALLRNPGHPGDFHVIEQNFDFDLLTPQKLLEKFVGKTVRVIRTNPATGEEKEETAQVLAAADGVVLKIGDRIETGVPGRLVYPDVPADLRDRPTLVVRLQSGLEASQQLELYYLTGGLSWSADYVAELGAADDRMDLSGWATLTNQSGTTFRHAGLQLVAGAVNRVPEVPQRPSPIMFEAAVTKAAAAPVTEEELFEYHLYSLKRPVTLNDHQSKQVALLGAEAVPVSREYLLRGSETYYRSSFGDQVQKAGVDVFLEFVNGDKNGLGEPLPGGVLRVYKKDLAGNNQFIGEDRIDHTPKNGRVRVRLGSAFDVTAERKQVDFQKLAGTEKYNYLFESAYRVELKNAKKEPVTVKVVEPVPGDWEMVEENHPHEKETAGTAVWRVEVPARGEAFLTYRVRVRF